MKTPIGRLADTEWDFRPLIHKNPTPEQRNELQAAIHYEYARESDSIRKLAAEYAALPKHERELVEGNFSLFDSSRAMFGPVSQELARMDYVAFWNCILWPEYFPQTPWLEIPPERRAERVQSYVATRGSGCAITVNQWQFLQPERLETPRVPDARFFISRIESVLLSVHWASATNDDIIAEFDTWVRKSRPKWIGSPRNDASRENVTTAFLTRLAVMRLLHIYPHFKSLDKAQNHDLRMPKQQSNALRMRRKVREDMHGIFQSELFQRHKDEPLIPIGESPRSWATTTEQQRARR